MDRWEYIIGLFQANSLVQVLGAVGEKTTAAEYNVLDTKVNGFFFLNKGTIEDELNTVYALGEPLLTTKDLWAVDTYVTLISDEIGIWNPFSWYPLVVNSKWAAIIDNVDSSDMQKYVDTLFDRGYGYVFLTNQDGFKTSSTYVEELIDAIHQKKATGEIFTDGERRLEASEPTYSWGCDDTLFHCSPVCLSQNGPVTTIAPDSKCADAPKDMCKCKCYYNAVWTCSNGEVVCQATKGIETMIVGDLLCENRGTEKPTFEELSEQRQAGECEPLPTTRGQFPVEQCLTQWATTTTEAPETTTEVPAEETTVAPVNEQPSISIEVAASFAAVASMFVALTQ
jgi:hypothetical protein